MARSTSARTGRRSGAPRASRALPAGAGTAMEPWRPSNAPSSRSRRTPVSARRSSPHSQVQGSEGTFSEPDGWPDRRSGRGGVRPRRSGPAPHATTTLGSRSVGRRPGVRRRAAAPSTGLAEEAADHDELSGSTQPHDGPRPRRRREEAVKMAYEGIERPRRAGWRRFYGNFRGATAADFAVPARPLAESRR